MGARLSRIRGLPRPSVRALRSSNGGHRRGNGSVQRWRCDSKVNRSAAAACGARELDHAKALAVDRLGQVLVHAQRCVATQATKRARMDLDLGGRLESGGMLGTPAGLEPSELFALPCELFEGAALRASNGPGRRLLRAHRRISSPWARPREATRRADRPRRPPRWAPPRTARVARAPSRPRRSPAPCSAPDSQRGS